MDRKYCTAIMFIAAVGAVLAGALTYFHYNPAGGEKFIFCSANYAGGCDALLQWPYATIFGIPLAGYGLFMFLLILFTALVADYAGGDYYLAALALVLPLSALSVAADIALAFVMIQYKTACLLCLMTYGINLLLLLISLGWYHRLKQAGGSLREIFRTLLPRNSHGPEKKAVAALYVITIFLLAFSLFSSSYILQIKTASLKLSREEQQRAVAAFYQHPAENPELPESQLRIGPVEAEVQIVAFTDFLCSACYQLFQRETEIRSKYGENVAFIYYNYPLDQTCNAYVGKTLYPSSCTASTAVLSAAALQVFPAYLSKHFSRYHEFHNKYGRDAALETVDGLSDVTMMQETMDKDAVAQILQRDILLAEKLNIKATPTIFINGRRMEGVPSLEVLDAIIQQELYL